MSLPARLPHLMRLVIVCAAMPIAAYMKIADELGAEIVTPLATEAMPSGKVTKEAYEYMAGLIVEVRMTS